MPEHDWVCDVYAEWESDAIRVPEPVHARGSASWSMDGWGAHVFLKGRDTTLLDELALVKEAGEAFHEAVAHLPRPAFMDDRDDPWAYGDRLASEDIEPEADAETAEVIAQLRAHARPVTEREQVVHGDLLPNVLVTHGGGLGIIDWPPYFRPASFAAAIAVHDAITFRAAPMSLLDDWATGPDWNQVMLRAILYRLGPTGIFATRDRLMGGLVTHVALGTPYYVDSSIDFVLLCGLLWWWKRSEGTLDIHSITTARRERFYWGTVGFVALVAYVTITHSDEEGAHAQHELEPQPSGRELEFERD